MKLQYLPYIPVIAGSVEQCREFITDFFEISAERIERIEDTGQADQSLYLPTARVYHVFLLNRGG